MLRREQLVARPARKHVRVGESWWSKINTTAEGRRRAWMMAVEASAGEGGD
jgi:hypothetical protein